MTRPFHDDLDQPIMARARARVHPAPEPAPADEAPPGRPQPMLNPPKVNVGALVVLAIITLFVLALAASIASRGGALEQPTPTAAPAATAIAPTTPPPPAPVSPAAVEAVPTAAGQIEAIDCAAEPGAWGCEPTPAPAPAYAPAAPPAHQKASELTPLDGVVEEAAPSDRLGSMPKPCTHPRCTGAGEGGRP